MKRVMTPVTQAAACMPVQQLHGMLYLNLSEGKQHALSFQMISDLIVCDCDEVRVELSLTVMKENDSHRLSLSFSLVLNWH